MQFLKITCVRPNTLPIFSSNMYMRKRSLRLLSFPEPTLNDLGPVVKKGSGLLNIVTELVDQTRMNNPKRS